MNLGVSCIYLEPPVYWTRQSGEGFDEESSRPLRSSLKEAMNDFFADEVISRGHILSQIRDELEEIHQECSREDWDNYGASPISSSAIEEAWNILQYMPLSLGRPEVVPEPHGGIGFEWRKGTSRALVLSVAGQHSISFAAIYEGGKIHGTEYFEESLPAFILSQFRRLAT